MNEKIEDSAEQAAMAAILTLQGKGYTYHGGQLWKPPIGNKPDFDLLDAAEATIAEQTKMIELLLGGPTPLYTAVDMANAARDGFRDGAASVVVELKVPASEAEKRWWVVLADCRNAIIAAGGSVKDE